MARQSLSSLADEQVLYLTNVGRTTGLPREIEIWFVVCRERFYLLAETGEAAGWVKNLRRNPKVTVRIGERQTGATARVLDRQADSKLWDEVAAIADRKYGWGAGLPVEITPLPSPAPDNSQSNIKLGGDNGRRMQLDLFAHHIRWATLRASATADRVWLTSSCTITMK
jgi:deazaflavin-dependent oxidoreductase (nitroreductase family)